jgi:hypothetical protein
MQGVYNVLTTIKDQLKSDKFVNTVTTGDIFEVDLKKQTIFPLSHIIINGATWENNVWRFSISILSMDIVDVSDEESSDFVGNTNEQDVSNTQLAVLSRLIAVLNNGDLNENLFQLDGNPDLEPFMERFENSLTGWTATLDVLIPNDSSSCDATGSITPILCEDGTVLIRNSSGDSIATVVVGSGDFVVEELPDTTYDIYLDGVFKETVTLPTLDPTNDLNIILQ